MQKRAEIKQEVTKTTATGGVTKRRALGDISNNINNTTGRQDDGSKENVSKKPVLQQHVQQQPRVADIIQHIVEPTVSMEINENAMVTSTEDELNLRVYMQRASDNIDARDAGNPLLVTEYVDPMYDHFRAAELEFLVNCNYMNSQPNINDKMRAILVDWLVSACSLV